MKPHSSATSRDEISSRRGLMALAFGAAAFTFLGSLVPFEFRARPSTEVFDSFAWAMLNRVSIQSRSDGIANVLLGVPLGFALLGVACSNRCLARSSIILRGLLTVTVTTGLAAAVEFVQLYAPPRTCCASDILAQGVGAFIGMGIWLAFGRRWTDALRGVASGTGAAGQFLLASVVLLAFTQALPFDMSLSPYGAYYKYRDGGIQLVPFQVNSASSYEEHWSRAAELFKLFALYMPVGIFAGILTGRFIALRRGSFVALAAAGLAMTLEIGQVFLKSRTASATDAVTGAGAVCFGWFLSRGSSTVEWPAGRRFVLACAWMIVLAVISWHPFRTTCENRSFDWLPLSFAMGGNPLIALDEVLAKLVLFGLWGALVVSATPNGRAAHAVVAACSGLLISAGCEAAQKTMAHHTPGFTDVVLGGVGAFCGAWITQRTRAGAHAHG